ncbi:hypothetical protein HMN09_00700800 [Mycena chlorophos]|uniref:Uncharacterized protein n=1 Tax=Mycena chlorophos TaxID=658473 RepID=A0A8H6T253_MYCCL|nr:hypothetical protein HMN09_00700800 [Mycena chlorophos]
MFFYISFLRPPPTSCSASLSITPQVANDLRTEFHESGPLDIYYSWLSVKTGEQTRPAKLTTWRGQASAYKEIPVPLPRGAAAGLWRLVLGASSIALDAENIGDKPFGVMSMPIQLGAGQSNKGKAKLQDQIERVYTFGEKRSRITEQTSFDLDKKVWDSGIGLSSWLVRNPIDDPNPLRILELSAGTGIVSLVLGALRPQDEIITTDVESAMPLLRHNIAQNASPVRAEVLDWDEDAFPEGAFDILVMADVTHNTASFPSLVKTVKKAVGARIIMGYKQRDPAERELWTMLVNEGIQLKHTGMVGDAIEIWTTRTDAESEGVH